MSHPSCRFTCLVTSRDLNKLLSHFCRRCSLGLQPRHRCRCGVHCQTSTTVQIFQWLWWRQALGHLYLSIFHRCRASCYLLAGSAFDITLAMTSVASVTSFAMTTIFTPHSHIFGRSFPESKHSVTAADSFYSLSGSLCGGSQRGMSYQLPAVPPPFGGSNRCWFCSREHSTNLGVLCFGYCCWLHNMDSSTNFSKFCSSCTLRFSSLH